MLQEIVDFLLVFAPSLGYVVQAHNIYSSKTALGYSIETSLILLTCNSLRVMYFIGEPFAVALLLQSIVMIGVQMTLVIVVLQANITAYLETIPAAEVAVEDAVGRSPISPTARLRPPSSIVPLHWTPRKFVLSFLTAFVLIAAVTLIAFTLAPVTIRAVGYLALSIESILIAPQIRLNFRRRSTEGLASALVATWVGGDILKMIYFLVLAQPAPFVFCAAVQLCLDVVLICQIIAFRHAALRAESVTSVREVVNDQLNWSSDTQRQPSRSSPVAQNPSVVSTLARRVAKTLSATSGSSVGSVNSPTAAASCRGFHSSVDVAEHDPPWTPT